MIAASKRSILDAVFAASPVAIVVLDAERLVTMWNGAAELLFGWSAREVIGGPLPYLATVRSAEIEAQYAALAAGQRVLALEVRRTRRDGSVVDLQLSSAAIHDDAGQLVGAVALMVDISARREADIELVAALAGADLEQRRLMAVLDAMPVGVWIANAGGALIQSNDAASRIWHGTLPEVTSQDGYREYKAWWPDTGKPVAPSEWALARLLRGETVDAPEVVEIGRFDGSRGYVLNSVAPIRNTAGEITEAVVVNVDITDRREASIERERLVASLAFERNRLAALFQQAAAFIVVLRGKDHVFELANDAYYQLVGFRELIGKAAADALPEVAAQGFVGIVDRVLASGEPFRADEMPVQLQREPDGPLEERFVSFVYQAIDEADGSRSGVLAHGIDVTDQVRSTELLRQSEARYRTVVDLSPDGIVVHRYGIIFMANAAAARMAGVADAGQLVGRSTRDFVQPSSQTLVDDRLRTLHAGDRVSAVEQEWRRHDGGVAYVEVASAAIDFDGFPAVQTVFRDVTERRLLEERLRESQKIESIGRLAGGVAHDFNNILTAIRGYAEMARSGLASTHPTQRDLAEIEQSVDRAALLTRQLLAFGRRQMMRPDILDVRHVVAGMENMLRRLAGSHVELVTRVDDATPAVLADRSQIEQIIVNLVVNASEALPDGGTIVIHVGEEPITSKIAARHPDAVSNRFTCIAVADNGYGMTSEVRDQIFEPFFTTKAFGDGSGLGLSTVYGIVKQSHGHIEVTSEPGQGTRVLVWIPIAEPHLAESEADSTSSQDAQYEESIKTVLIAEDAPAVRSVMRRALRGAGYYVIEAADGAEAFDTLKRPGVTVDLLITDLTMPRMGGPQLIAASRELGHRTALLVVTGDSGNADLLGPSLPPETVFIDKPFTTVELVAAAARALSVRRAHDDQVLSSMPMNRR